MESKIREELRSLAETVPPHGSLPERTRRRARRGMAFSALAGTLAIGLAAYGGLTGIRALRAAPPPPTPASIVSCDWTRVPSPNEDPSIYTNELLGLAVVSGDDVWAVGGYYQLGGEGSGPERALILHWDGTTWNSVPLPNIRPAFNLNSMAAISADDVWAVGSVSTDGSDRPLALHWDGSSWSEVPTPDTGKTYSHLRATAAVSAQDVWAVGNWASGEGAAGTLVMHWDGSAWTVVSSPDPSPRPQVGWSYPGLEAVAATDPTDVWAVGTSDNVAPAGPSNTLAIHWDGTAWSVAPTPDVPGNTGSPFDALASVSAASADDVWAVGSYGLGGVAGDASPLPYRTLALHWDGAAWSVIPTEAGDGSASLSGVAAVSATEAWAVGQTHGVTEQALIERWDGTSWSVVQTPVEEDGRLDAVTAAPSGELWAVGSARIPDSENWGTLVLHADCR